MLRALHILLFCVLAATEAAARAQSDEPKPPAVQLQLAKEAYVLGDFERARAAFLSLVQRARVLNDVDATIVGDAWLHLGELQLFEGDRRAAEGSFRMALLADPDLRVSPVEHPESVIGVVEVVRQAVQAETDTPRRLKTLPWWGYTPLGAPQYVQRHPVRGAIYTTLQVGAAASSIAAWVEIERRRAAIPNDPPREQLAAAQAELERVEGLRASWSIPSAAAFYVVWAISVGDAGIAWRKSQLPPMARAIPRGLSVLPTPDGLTVEASWRF